MYFLITIKTLILYFYIVFAYRMMGKKEVGKLSIIDLIVSVLIAELAAISIESYNNSILVSLIPIMVLVIIQILLSYATLKMPNLRKLLDGNPKIIINKGKVNFKEMKKLRYSLDDLITQLREQSIKSIEDVDYAVLENNGKLSIFKKTCEYPLPIIVDGKIDENVIRDLKKNKKWVYNMLQKYNLKLEDVFYAFYRNNGIFIIKNSDLL